MPRHFIKLVHTVWAAKSIFSIEFDTKNDNAEWVKGFIRFPRATGDKAKLIDSVKTGDRFLVYVTSSGPAPPDDGEYWSPPKVVRTEGVFLSSVSEHTATDAELKAGGELKAYLDEMRLSRFPLSARVKINYELMDSARGIPFAEAACIVTELNSIGQGQTLIEITAASFKMLLKKIREQTGF